MTSEIVVSREVVGEAFGKLTFINGIEILSGTPEIGQVFKVKTTLKSCSKNGGIL